MSLSTERNHLNFKMTTTFRFTSLLCAPFQLYELFGFVFLYVILKLATKFTLNNEMKWHFVNDNLEAVDHFHFHLHAMTIQPKKHLTKLHTITEFGTCIPTFLKSVTYNSNLFDSFTQFNKGLSSSLVQINSIFSSWNVSDFLRCHLTNRRELTLLFSSGSASLTAKQCHNPIERSMAFGCLMAQINSIYSVQMKYSETLYYNSFLNSKLNEHTAFCIHTNESHTFK